MLRSAVRLSVCVVCQFDNCAPFASLTSGDSITFLPQQMTLHRERGPSRAACQNNGDLVLITKSLRGCVILFTVVLMSSNHEQQSEAIAIGHKHGTDVLHIHQERQVYTKRLLYIT